MDLRGMKIHGEHPVDPCGDQEVGDQAPAQGDAGGILLVGAGVGVVRDHRCDLRRRRAAGGVDHQQQLHEVLLGGGHQRLHDIDVPLTAVVEQLRLEAVVAEAGDLHVTAGNLQMVTDLVSQLLVGGTGEDDDAFQQHSPC